MPKYRYSEPKILSLTVLDQPEIYLSTSFNKHYLTLSPLLMIRWKAVLAYGLNPGLSGVCPWLSASRILYWKRNSLGRSVGSRHVSNTAVHVICLDKDTDPTQQRERRRTLLNRLVEERQLCLPPAASNVLMMSMRQLQVTQSHSGSVPHEQALHPATVIVARSSLETVCL